MRETKSEYLNNELKNFRETCERMLECEERLLDLAESLRGDAVHSIQYSRSPTGQRNPYQSNFTELMEQEVTWIEERDFYLKSVRRIARKLRKLNDQEVLLLYYIYEKELSYRAIALIEHCNKNIVAKELENIIEKMNR